MDIGEEGHILLSARIAEDLRQLSDNYKQIIHPLGIYSFKHGQSTFIYSIQSMAKVLETQSLQVKTMAMKLYGYYDASKS
jgi:hypothetical protein